MSLFSFHRHCPLCEEEKKSALYFRAREQMTALSAQSFSSRKMPENLHPAYRRCAECSVLYASPAVSPCTVDVAYEQAHFVAAEESKFAARAYRRAVEALLPRLPDKSGVVDIGAGDGSFLKEMQTLGFTDLVGFELSLEARKAAPSSIRDQLRPAPFSTRDLAAESFSLVTAFQVLEHVSDPAACFRDVLRLLKPGGVFLAVSHDYHSWTNRLMGDRSPICDVQHYQLFSKNSMVTGLRGAGFSNVRVSSFSNTYPLRYWMKLAPVPSFLKRFVERSRLGKIPLKLRAGNLVAVAGKA